MRSTSVRNGEYDLLQLYGRMATRDAPTSSAYVPMKAGAITAEYAARQWQCIFGCICSNPGKPNHGTVWFDERGFGAHLRNRHIDRTTGQPFAREIAYATRYGGSRVVEQPASIIHNTHQETHDMQNVSIDYDQLAAAMLRQQNAAQAQTAITVSPRDAFIAEKVKLGLDRADAEFLADRKYGSKADVQAKPAEKPAVETIGQPFQLTADVRFIVQRDNGAGTVKLLRECVYKTAWKSKDGKRSVAAGSYGQDSSQQVNVPAEKLAAFGAWFAATWPTA